MKIQLDGESRIVNGLLITREPGEPKYYGTYMGAGESNFLYACEGSENINATYEELKDGVDMEQIIDTDTVMANAPVSCLEDLEIELEEI